MLKVERRICGHKWDRTRLDQLARRRQNFAPTAEIWSASMKYYARQEEWLIG